MFFLLVLLHGKKSKIRKQDCDFSQNQKNGTDRPLISGETVWAHALSQPISKVRCVGFQLRE